MLLTRSLLNYAMVRQSSIYFHFNFAFYQFFISRIFFVGAFSNYHGLVSMHKLDVIAENLERSLLEFHEIHTSMHLLPKGDGRVVAEDVNAEAVLENVADQITELFAMKRIAVENMVEKLEWASENYVWEDELKNNFTGVAFMNVTTEEESSNSPGVIDNLFGVAVNKSMAAIHVPLEVYEGYPQIVNGLRWSSVVDAAFKENSGQDPSLSWQYFSGAAGFMRFYPSVPRWYIPPTYNSPDLFDSRRRPWYIQASASPKDVIILMDRSGSVHGQTFTIMKFAIETLIDTLGENDYVNIAAFNKTTFWVSTIVHDSEENPYPWECKEYTESLLQATNINKRALVADIQHLSVKGVTNYSNALNFAYEAFKKRSENGQCGSGCHKLMMVFSDGGTEWPEDVINKFLNDSATSDVRIFSYAVGPHPIPTVVLKRMACDTGGQFNVITTSSGVRTKIQESYVGKIGEPLASSGSHIYQYTSLYTSAITQNLTISLSLPVFNKSKALGEGRSQLIGVAGVDIPAQQLENLIPRETLGPLGYAFIINNNGILAMHPYIHTQESYLQDPPHLDLLDKELNGLKMEDVRTKMLNGERGVVSFSGRIFLDPDRVFPKASRIYTYMSLADTPYSLGISISTPRTLRHLRITNPLPVLNIDPRTSLLAPWNFCGVHPALPKPDLINKRILDNITQCNQELINSLMWAQEWTNGVVRKWERDSEAFPDIISRAIFTRFGLARVVKGRGAIVNGSISALPPLGTEWRDPLKNPALRRGLLEEGLAVFSHSHGAFLSQPVFMTNVEAAVIGVNATSKKLDKMLMEAIAPVMPSNGSFILLVDESATIVASSQYENSSGEFLGSSWPLLLEKLVEAGVYEKINVTNYEALCSTKHDVSPEISAADHLTITFHPLKLIAAAITNLFSLFEFLQCCMMSLFISFSTSPGVEAIYRAGNKEGCILQQTAYFLTERTTFSGNISCLGDSAQVLVKRLNFTNVVVVAVESSLVNLSCDDWIDQKDFKVHTPPFRARRIKRVDPKEIACRKPRSRKRPLDCEASKPTQCSSCQMVTVEGALVILGLFINVLRI